MRVGAGVKENRDKLGVLKRHTHLECVIGQGQNHLLFVRHDHGLRHVNHLGDVGHADTICMAGEDVQDSGPLQGLQIPNKTTQLVRIVC